MKRWLVALGAVIALGGSWYAWRVYRRIEAPILVGILHSKTGPLAISEQSMIDHSGCFQRSKIEILSAIG